MRCRCDGTLERVYPADLGEYGELRALHPLGTDRLLIGGGDVGMSPGPGTYGIVARMWM
jgi:hypothetical protein